MPPNAYPGRTPYEYVCTLRISSNFIIQFLAMIGKTYEWHSNIDFGTRMILEWYSNIYLKFTLFGTKPKEILLGIFHLGAGK